MKKMRKIFLAMCIATLTAFISCDEEASVNPDGLTEFNVDINGNWKIGKITQNGVDITQSLDYESFSLELKNDGISPPSFKLDSKFPFVTKNLEGSWSFNDPTYPTLIEFSDGTSSLIEKPLLSSGNIELFLNFRLGCSNTNYQYKLIKKL